MKEMPRIYLVLKAMGLLVIVYLVVKR
jgi:hypothetical protein